MKPLINICQNCKYLKIKYRISFHEDVEETEQNLKNIPKDVVKILLCDKVYFYGGDSQCIFYGKRNSEDKNLENTVNKVPKDCPFELEYILVNGKEEEK